MIPPTSPRPDPGAGGRWRAVSELIGPALVLAAASAAGALTSPSRGHLSPLWPASGVALWMAWRYGRRALPVVGLISGLVTLAMAATPANAAITAAAAVLEAALGAAWLRRMKFRGTLQNPREALALIGPAALGSTAVGAAVAVAGLCVTGEAAWASFGPLWRTWWAGGALGNLVVAPALIVWSVPAPVAHPRRTLEFAVVLAISALATVVGNAGALLGAPGLVMRFLSFPALIWTAMRFGPRETTVMLLATAAVATGLAVTPYGPGASADWMVPLQILLAVLAVTTLLMVAVAESRRVVEAQLRATLSLLEATLDSTADGILVVDREGQMRTYNRRFVELWGLPSTVLATRDDRRAIEAALGSLKDPASFLARIEELYARPDAESFDTLELRDGRIFERYSLPQREGQRVVGRVWSFRDVSQRKRMEEEVRQISKMEAVGRLAGGVAHEYNNLLTVILGHSEMLGQSPSATDTERQKLGEIRRAAERAAALNRQLLAFGRRQQLAPRVLDLNEVVRDSEGLLRPLVGESVELRLDLAADLGAVRADRGAMQQILLHLALNARDAMPDGGRLTVRTGRHTLVDDDLTRELGLAPGPHVVLTVSDTGGGMNPEVRERLFEPFFTTKDQAGSAGLGLAAVYGMVKQSGGGIRVTSQPDEGSSFHIYLPLIGDRVGSERPGSAALRP